MSEVAEIRVDEPLLASLTDRVAALEQAVAKAPNPDALNLLVFSGERDRLLAAFVMATGAAACGQDVSMFFTFWGTPALRDPKKSPGPKSIVEKAFGWMLPRGAACTKLSQMDFGGLGRAMMGREMRQKNIADLDELISTAAELGVTIRVCDMSMKLMGIQPEELIDYPGLAYCGVAQFTAMCSDANTTLFI
ncbi:MAG: DsrE/DsrF/DrsH-like family protein [Planctomycetaceae bacterium]|nr:DsrE/DsrF/DrsH-like family protein [Planctomycetaceae bacterium]